MPKWAKIRSSDGAWLSPAGGEDTQPTPGAGEQVIMIPMAALDSPPSMIYVAGAKAFRDLMTEAQCLALVDARASALRAPYITLGPGMADEYRETLADVAALNTLGGTAAQILAKLLGMTDAQQQANYPFLYAEMKAAGLTDLTKASAAVSAAQAASRQARAAIKKSRRQAKIAIRAATTLAAKNAAATGASWPT